MSSDAQQVMYAAKRINACSLVDKKKIATVSTMLVIMAACTGPSATYINRPKDKYVPSILRSDLNLSRKTASLNCSFKVLNPDGVIVEVDAVNINDVNLGEIKGAAVYVNGTVVNCTESFFGINPLDVIYVNVVVP